MTQYRVTFVSTLALKIEICPQLLFMWDFRRWRFLSFEMSGVS